MSFDRDALADRYDRYANALYELCRAVLGDAHEAADALHDTFVIAATRLDGLRDPSRLKTWLGAIARHEALRRSTKGVSHRLVGKDDVLEVPVAGTEATRGLAAEDAPSLVWEAADALTARERAVLVLNVRLGIDGAELAAAAGLPASTTSALLRHAKTVLASAVRCTLLLRDGRDACGELAQIVPRKHAALDEPMRKRVARHAPRCPICAPTWNQTPEALGVLAAAPLVGAPVALRHEVLHDPRLVSFSSPMGDGTWQRDGFPPHEPDESRRRIIGGFAAALVAIAVAVVLMLVGGGDDAPSLAAPHVARTTTTDVEDFAPWPTSPKDGKTTTTVKKATTTTAKRATTTTRANAAGVTTPPPARPTTTTTAPPFSISASARQNSIACNTGTADVVATTQGGDASALFLHWSEDGGSGGAKGMDNSGSSWTGVLGTFDHAETVTWWVSTVFVGNGGTRSASHTIDVTC